MSPAVRVCLSKWAVIKTEGRARETIKRVKKGRRGRRKEPIDGRDLKPLHEKDESPSGEAWDSNSGRRGRAEQTYFIRREKGSLDKSRF